MILEVKVADSVIDLGALTQGVSTPEDGALISFLGIVRAHNHGKKVVAVSYDAFGPLAEVTLKKIGEEAREKWGRELGIRIIHRTGKLLVGETSLGIVVTSKHRDEAFLASRYILEELKVRVPIWKKEHYEDGETQWLRGHALCNHSQRITIANKLNLKGIVLAGGKSSRMGQDKALLPLANSTLLAHMVNVLSQAVGGEVIVSGNYPEFLCIPDQTAGLGPLGGIGSVGDFLLSENDEVVALIVPVDMPKLKPQTLKELIHVAKMQSHAQAVHFQDYALPCVLRLNQNTQSVIKRLLTQSPIASRSVRALLHELKAIEILPANNNDFTNANTPAEYHEVIQ